MPRSKATGTVADPTLALDGAVLRLSGPVTLNTVAPLMARGHGLLPRLPEQATLDLSGVTRIDSAGVAMLVELWRLREREGRRLGFAANRYSASQRPTDLLPGRSMGGTGGFPLS